LLWLIALAAIGSAADDRVVRFELVHDYLIVARCAVGDLPTLTAVVDTGATDTVLDSRVVRRLALPTTVDSAVFVTREVGVRSAIAPSLTFGPIRSGPMPVISSDLSAIGDDLGIRIDVIIGMDVLRQSDFLIDYKEHVLRFGPSAPMAHRARFENRERLATVPISGLGRTLNLLVDTGFSQMLLFRDRIGDQAGMHGAAMDLATGGGRQNLRQIDTSSIQIGDCRLDHATLLIGEDDRRLRGTFDGLLGVRFLRARRIAFDFQAQILSWN
jgi:predicted aspartyl protease